MGIFEKIKDMFAKTTFESLQDLEKEIKLLHGKAIFSDIVSLIGVGGRLKGLPLIYSVKEESEFKMIVARISELIKPLNNLKNDKELMEINLVYKGLYLIFMSINDNVGFLGVSPILGDLSIFREWIKKNNKQLISIFTN